MSFWDQRFERPGYLFGTEPAAFLRAQAGALSPGSRVLCVADGEGRNSVYLAGLGHRVTAFDASPVAQDKARALAAEKGVSVDFHQSGIEAWDWSQPYDAVVGVFIQFAPPELRDRLFGWMARAVAPGGLLLLHGYAPRQVDYGTGGPPNAENMYTEALLRAAFDGWEILRLADYDAEIDEGEGHSGRSALVDLVARKPG
ncbi:SAM-dependent methyltransferase [Antarcticimicrobium luteum]|uniref:Class I SAM-dependent methyltransferase n=1 Tax=Antarcticimicrobium luteum TaxID=2547397 RepID=A0A4R5VF20_9RHOB|nr:class I SAM-dependent methyltransferase [Antarcticimicrobium luteum]TDK50339.1 class I SAM-dependent methyltransferase [Antarcticimicrobium luteum]